MAFTTTGSVAWDQAAYNRLLYYTFNEENVFDRIASVEPTEATNPFATVTFFKAQNLTPTSTSLDESTDVTPEAMSDGTVVLTLNEYGKAVRTTQLLRLISLVPVIPAVGKLLGINSAQSLDYVAIGAIALGANVLYSGSAIGSGSRAALTPANVFSSKDVRNCKNRLRRKSVPKLGGAYNMYCHSDALYDLQSETGALGWSDSTKYTSDIASVNFEIQRFNGFDFIETAHSPIIADAGTSPYATTDVYQSFAVGYEALGKGYSSAEGYGPMPMPVMSPTTDALNRFLGWGWKWFGGYKVFRDESLYRVESASSVGAN